jgi:chitinase
MRFAFATLLCLMWPAIGWSAQTFRVVGYTTGWSARTISNEQAKQLTHINHAFATIRDGVLAEPNSKTLQQFAHLRAIKAKHSNLRTLISVGGWAGSGSFSDIAATEASRSRFARSCVAFVKRHGFDGVDLDWEFPVAGGLKANGRRPEDGVHFVQLLARLRSEMGLFDQKSGTNLITIATPAPAGSLKHFDLAAMAKHVDWFNVMAYDFSGSWSSKTAHHAALVAKAGHPSVTLAIAAHLKPGVDASKIVLGVPFYGRLFEKVQGDQGLGAAHTTRGEATALYRDLVTDHLKRLKVRRDDNSSAPWLFDAKAKQLITYDDAASLKAKANFVRQKKLGGMMIWSLDGDDDKDTLLKAIVGIPNRKR